MANAENEIIIMTRKEFEKIASCIVYEESKLANDHQYKGIAPFLYEIQDSFRDVFKELEYIKTLLRTKEPIQSNKASGGVVKAKKEKVGDKTETVVSPNSILSRLSEEQIAKLVKRAEEVKG